MKCVGITKMSKFITLTSSDATATDPKVAINTDYIVYIAASDYCSTVFRDTKTRIEYYSGVNEADTIYVTEDFHTVVRLCNGEY